MTDKVQKIREEVERLQIELIQEKENGFGSDADDACILELQNILTYIDSLQKEPVSEDFEKIVEEIAEPTILNAYGTKELARRLRNTICGTSVSENLEKAAKADAMVERSNDTEVGYDLNRYGGFIAGAKWKEQQFEKERLKHCDELTAEQAQIESDFVTKHLKENNRTPTFIDAIEYGMKLKKEPSYITKKVGSYTTTTRIIKKGEKV